MDKSIIFNQVMILFLLMAIGFIIRKGKILNPELTQGLTGLLLNVTSPILAFSSFQFDYSREMLVNAALIFGFAMAAHLGAILLGKVLFFRFPGDTGKVLRFCTVFSNCGFMGYPIIGGLFGAEGIFYTSIYVAVFTLFLWTYGVFVYTGKTDPRFLKKAFLNPGMIAVGLGLLVFLGSVKLPAPLAQALDSVGEMTTPIAMITIGAMLADIKPLDIVSGFSVYYGSFIRLLLIPVLTLFVLKAIGMTGITLGVSVIAVAMPAAALSVPLAQQNDCDAVFASRLVFMTTIFSIFTIPMIIWMI